MRNALCLFGRLFILPLAFLTAPVQAEVDAGLNEGFQVRNRSPMVGIFGLPSHRSFDLPGEGQYKGGIQLGIHNTFNSTSLGNERLYQDVETYVLTFSLRRGLTDNWSLGLDLPLVSHRGGFLDSMIDTWHDWFDLENFDRGDAPEDEIHFSYSRDGDTVLEIDDDVSDVGDIILSLGRRIGSEDNAALWIELKAPTGDPDKLTGSGGFDLGMRFQGRARVGQKSTLFAGLGIAWLEEGDVFAEMQRQWAGSLTTGYSWQGWKRVALKIQIDAQSAVFKDTNVEFIKESAAQLSLGGSVRVGKTGFLDIAIVEDEWRAGGSPDFGFTVRYRR